MNNEQLVEMIHHLKNEGVSYTSIAMACNLPFSYFYYHLKTRRYPYQIRKKIEDVLKAKYTDLLRFEQSADLLDKGKQMYEFVDLYI